MDLLRGSPAVRTGRRTENVDVTAADLQHEEDVDPLEGERAIDMEKSHASIVDVCARRNCRRVVSIYRSGPGRMRARLKIRRIIEALTFVRA